MAFALRKHDSEFESQPIADINVTPLVDVMLVLLIVFMVAAPLMTSGIPVDLPKTQAKQLNDQKPPIVVSVDANGGFFVDKKEVDRRRRTLGQSQREQREQQGPPHPCSRRQERRLWPNRRGHGHHQRRRLRQGGARLGDARDENALAFQESSPGLGRVVLPARANRPMARGRPAGRDRVNSVLRSDFTDLYFFELWRNESIPGRSRSSPSFCSPVIRYDTHGRGAGDQGDVKTDAVE